ncbi:MAG: radical SAM protein [Oscillospiraceae bacterium]|nr:radical SAM protein [Oscillospiraceae bacterium]
MNLTLHLTEACNLHCAYCIRTHRPVRMSETVLKAACDLAFSEGNHAGLCFFGGEPLLERGLISEAMAYCAARSAETGKPVQYKMTTNGTLLDAEFLEKARDVHMGIGLSFDGTAQNICRRTPDGNGSFEMLNEKAKLLLRYLPDSYAMMTIAPEAAGEYAASVKYLHQLGFRRISAVPAYGKNVHWTDESFTLLTQQLREAAAYYEAQFRAGKPFFFSALDSKIRECIAGENPSERCHLGFRQMPVAPNGKIYACTQFIGDADFCLGDVFTGLDRAAQRRLADREAVPETCRACALRKRCTNACGCMNRLETGDENRVSPLQCSYERMLIELADETAERLYAHNPDLFRKRYL